MISTEEQNKQQRATNLLQRNIQKNRLRARKTEREVLQCASKQNVKQDANSGLAEEISQSNPQLALDLQLKKSLTFKDPSRTHALHSVFYITFLNTNSALHTNMIITLISN